MSALLTAASSQYFSNSTPALVSTGYPFSVGMWVRLTTLGSARAAFSFSDTGTTNNYLYMGVNASNVAVAVAAAGATDANAVGSALVAAEWTFLLAKFVSASSRSITQISASGLISGGSTSVSRAPTSLDRLTIGALESSSGVTLPWNGNVAEMWYTNTDIKMTIGSDLPFKLAYEGPFSIPHIRSDIIEYRSFRNAASINEGSISELFIGAAGQQTWTAPNSSTFDVNPSFPYTYVRPGQVMVPLVF